MSSPWNLETYKEVKRLKLSKWNRLGYLETLGILLTSKIMKEPRSTANVPNVRLEIQKLKNQTLIPWRIHKHFLQITNKIQKNSYKLFIYTILETILLDRERGVLVKPDDLELDEYYSHPDPIMKPLLMQHQISSLTRMIKLKKDLESLREGTGDCAAK